MNIRLSRRQFIKGVAVAGVGMTLPLKFGVRSAHAFYQSPGLPKFSQLLRGRDVASLATEIGVAAPDGLQGIGGATHYTMSIKQFTDTLHPAFAANSTTLWGFVPQNYLVAGPANGAHLGGILVTEKGTPIQITFKNILPPTHIIPVDITIPGANAAQNRVAVHLHGGHVPWISDGGPFDWFDPAGNHGMSFLNNQVLNPGALPGEAEYWYTNDQSARFMWYHDHAFGLTRINAYAGIASAYIVRDNFERGLVSMGMPGFIETTAVGSPSYEIPLVFQDKIFVDNANIAALDPTWLGPNTTGSLWYPHLYEKNRWKLSGKSKILPDPSVVPEMFGDTMLVNGTVSPELHVQPRKYRFRILNACNARFLNLQLWAVPAGTTAVPLNAKTLLPAASPGPNFLQIGTEGGMLPHPVTVPSNMPFNPLLFNGSLIVAPAERPDIIVDFSAYNGQTLLLYNDAPAPFPFGDPRYDFFFGAPKNPAAPLTVTSTPDTRNLLRIVVDQPLVGSDPALGFGPATDFTTLTLNSTVYNDPLLAQIVNNVPQVQPGITTRQLTLNEAFDINGRLIQYLGTNVQGPIPGTFGRAYTDTPTEVVPAGSTEIWEIANLTGDTHPIHFHLVNVQILNRQPFNAAKYTGIPIFTGPARPPDPNELGWKETVRMNPFEVTRVIMQFTLPVVPFTVPISPRTGGHEYVWHCHILEHEEHDMMRPLIVI